MKLDGDDRVLCDDCLEEFHFCDECEEYAECIQLLWDYADELGIKLVQTADPTKIAEELFSKVKEMV